MYQQQKVYIPISDGGVTVSILHEFRTNATLPVPDASQTLRKVISSSNVFPLFL